MGRHLISGAWRFSHAFLQYNSQIVKFQIPSLQLYTVCTPSRSPHLRVTLPQPHWRQIQIATFPSLSMASSGQETTASVPSIENLTLQSTGETSKFVGCYPSLNPVDVYRQHIAEELGKSSGIDPETIYQRLAWTNSLDKGDLALPVSNSHLIRFQPYFITPSTASELSGSQNNSFFIRLTGCSLTG